MQSKKYLCLIALYFLIRLVSSNFFFSIGSLFTITKQLFTSFLMILLYYKVPIFEIFLFHPKIKKSISYVNFQYLHIIRTNLEVEAPTYHTFKGHHKFLDE
jgi:hypothetical protein